MTTQRIKELVEDYFNLDLSEKTRKRNIVHIRFLYYNLAYNHASDGMSLTAVGKTIGGFDHATVLYGLRQYKNLYEFDRAFRNRINPFLNEVEEELNKNSIEGKRTIHRQIRRMKERIFQMEKQLEEIS